ncbi:MAG TPA: hypothetical protein VF017_16105 [Thermoanaerobaculia bacterium]|nr:hypothetical protein [Thermoanaerobaculia bacterium]
MYRHIDSSKVQGTLGQLGRRISERFPNSGLSKVCAEIELVARETEEHCSWIARPQWSIRAAVGAVILIAALGLASVFVRLQVRVESLDVSNILQGAEAATNELVLLGLAAVFLAGVESRVKRKRALQGLHQLRALAHVVDMHQLTKDPESSVFPGRSTPSSPQRNLSPFEMVRYLDYASEMLALIGKVAAVYAQHFDDPAVLAAVNDIEDLTTNLSQKIWQKVTIVESLRDRAGSH